MEEQEMTNNTETSEKMEDFGINADENAAGTSHLNEPVSEQPALLKIQAELQDQKVLAFDG